jgi:hypothetical protein
MKFMDLAVLIIRISFIVYKTKEFSSNHVNY